jgi:23S rRNA (uracil1939-C5)-methyltransferase
LRAGQKVTLRFRAFNQAGSGVAAHGAQTVAVPFALPGEEAVVEIMEATRLHADGRIVALLRKSRGVVDPRCRHFGRCGGCQWQHLPYAAQLAAKTRLIQDMLAAAFPGRVLVREAVGSSPWEYRSRLQAVLAVRRDRTVAGYSGVGDRAIINVQECPIQHPANVRMLRVAREIITSLGWPIYDQETRRGLLRGLILQTGVETGEGMLVLCATGDVPDRMAFVRAAIERLPDLRSILLSVRAPRTAELLGRIELLWGRPSIVDVIAGLRLQLYPAPAVPPNPRAVPTYLDAIRRAVGPATTAVDAACEEGLVPIALAVGPSNGPGVGMNRVVGIAPDREAMHRAWENARANGAAGCAFYTRDAVGIIAKLRSRGEAFDALLVSGRGGVVTPPMAAAAAGAGYRRIVYAGASATRFLDTVHSAATAGYRLTDVQPVDLLPQTSRVHLVAALTKDA